MNFTLNQDFVVRLLVFAALLAVMFLWEQFSPRRTPIVNQWQRRGNNLALVVTDTVVTTLLMPIAAVGAAGIAAMNGWGLLYSVEIPYWSKAVISYLLLDLIIYGQHILFHKSRWLWRLHRVHHTDLDFDVTTGLRFHPIEILLSMLIKIAAVIALGAPVVAVMLFEIVLNASAMFNHGNVYIPPRFDRWLRWLIVTPDMHRVHHSVLQYETDSNYGFNIPWWDRLFGTYRNQPVSGHQQMEIGLREFQGPGAVNIFWLLAQPFLNPEQLPKQKSVGE